MIAEETPVMAFPMIKGPDPISIPYINQRMMPVKKRTYIAREIPEVSFVLIVLTACGKKAIVVKVAAIYPSISIKADG